MRHGLRMDGLIFTSPLLGPRPPLAERAMIGIVAPATNITVQPEMEVLRPPGVCNQHARIANPNSAITGNTDTLAARQIMLDGLDAAIDSLLPCGPDHIALGVMVENFAGGGAAGEALLEGIRKRTGRGVSDWSSAMLAALRALGGRKRVAILTPFMPVGDAAAQQFFEETGHQVTAVVGLKAPSPYDTGRITVERQIEALRALDATGPEVIVQAGTNLAFAQLAVEAERWLGKPVIAANTVIYWHALRSLGLADALPAAGRLGLVG